jgi:hypothetical protein
LKKDTQSRKQGLRRLNTAVIHAGDIRSEAEVISKRFQEKSSGWRHFSTLYGLTLDDMKNLGIIYTFP